jgi:DNA-binding protein HU-beta
MNKTELIKVICEKAGGNLKHTEIYLNATIASIEEALTKGEKVVLVGFGTFEVKDRAVRKGRNPQTSEEIQIPASKAPIFRAGKSLKDAINA